MSKLMMLAALSKPNQIALGTGAFFDGSGDGLDITIPAVNTGNCTIEGYIMLTALTASNSGYFSIGAGSSGDNLDGQILTGNPSGLYVERYTGVAVGGNKAISLNRLYHFALTKNGSTFTYYVDGTLINTFTQATSLIATTFSIGRMIAQTNCVIGLLKDVRLYNAVIYSANFTPPAFGHKTADPFAANLIFEVQAQGTPGATTFTDTGPSARAVTRTGNVVIANIPRWVETDKAIYFATVGNDLRVTIPAIGTSDCTFEGYTYPISGGHHVQANWSKLFNLGATNGQGAVSLSTILNENPTRILAEIWNPTTNGIVTTSAMPNNSWTHWALCKVGNVWTLYFNGQPQGTLTLAFNITQTLMRIGNGTTAFTTETYNGYQKDFRVYNTAKYTGAFTPPARGVSDVSALRANLLLELLFNDPAPGSTFTDTSGNNRTVTRLGSPTVHYSPGL
jgi:hypothetical protein